MGKPGPAWPSFVRPPGFAAATVLEVARDGVWSGSEDGHAAAVLTWAAAVWDWWKDAHPDVEQLTQTLLGGWLAAR
jgi:hypothetical protein